MPDKRTVYTTGDHPNGVLLKFVADRPGDLSSGALSAIKLSNQRSDADGRPTWDVAWVELGRGNQRDLDRLVYSGLKFADMFEVAQPSGSPPKCPPGFSATNHPSLIYQHVDSATFASYHMECLKIKAGMETPAAFFESRRVAAIKGATTEFEKQDGLTWSPRYRQLYFADTRIAKGMTSDSQFNYASQDAIRLRENACGGLFAIDLDAGYSGTLAKLILGGDSLGIASDVKRCSSNNVRDPEKTEYVAGNLLIQEGSEARDEAIMWAYNLEDGSLTKILSAPMGTELTGIGANRIGDSAYLTFTVQQPQAAKGAAPARGQMGYIGPLPADALSDKFTLKFSPVAGAGTGGRIQATAKVCIAPAKAGRPKAPGAAR
ncbi:MAG: hypothetical protein J3K34DRAFT_436439 [Monoraphidium minutum]|nr:MAG: hypothetical protein J3K34DRAFT_436439 [Monoraphidium minutum]